jgi:FHS family L-fucose permease-like MFS transporter
MASFSGNTPRLSSNTTNPQADYTPALVSLMILFFMMGFTTCLNDVLIPVLKGAFALNYTQSMLVQFCFFTAYLVMSFPSSMIVQKVGYKRGMIGGFVAAGVGCLLFVPAAQHQLYVLFLGALFILASGITLLQVAANPYVAILGRPETASSRLTLTQAFNSVGTTIAPKFGEILILGSIVRAAIGTPLTPEQVADNLDKIKYPYIGIACTLFVIAVIVGLLKLPAIQAEDVQTDKNSNSQAADSAWDFKHLRFGVGGIFVYVGAEVAIGSLLILFMEKYAGLTEDVAGGYLSYYWGGAMIGRFIGSAILQRVRAGYVLAANAAMAALLVLCAVLLDGHLGMYALLAVGFFNSIMFPTIFTLAVAGLGKHTNQASGLLSTAIFGGAAIPVIQGALADAVSLQFSFLIPVICYLYIAWYGLKGHEQ